MALALLAPGVKTKALEGDVEGALADAQEALSSVEGLNGKAAYVGGVVVVDAVAHLPVLGALLPGPAEFVGTAAAVLLAAKYFVEKETTPEEDLARLGASLPGDVPSPDDILKPAGAFAKRLGDVDLDILQDDLKQAPARAQSWLGGLDDPAGTVAPPAAAPAPPCWRARSRTCPCWRWRSRARLSWSAWRTCWTPPTGTARTSRRRRGTTWRRRRRRAATPSRSSPGSEFFTKVFRREANVTNARDVRDVRDVRDTR